MPFHAMYRWLLNTASPGGWPTPRSMLSIFAPSMLPQPVQASQPATDGYPATPPLALLAGPPAGTMSRNALVPFE